MIDESTFEEVVRQHCRQWQSAAWRVTGNGNDADDAVQDALAAAWDRRESFKEQSSFSTFIYSTVVHKAYDLVRRAAVRRQRESQWRPEPSSRNNGFLYDAIARLPELYRTTVIAMLGSEMHPMAAAALLGCSENAVCKRMQKAKKLLSGFLDQPDKTGGSEKNPKKFFQAGRIRPPETTK